MGILEGGIIAVVFFFLGKIHVKRRYRPPKRKPPVCDCKHGFAYHDAETRHCHALVQGEPTQFDRYPSRSPVAWEQIQCPCRQYTGPEPLPEYFATEIT